MEHEICAKMLKKLSEKFSATTPSYSMVKIRVGTKPGVGHVVGHRVGHGLQVVNKVKKIIIKN